MLVGLSALVTRLWWVQVARGYEWTARIQSSSEATVRIPSIRGASVVIATNAVTNAVTNAHDEDVAYAIARVIVFGSVAMFAYPFPADGKAWIVAATTFLPSIALAATGSTNLRKLTAKGFRPALLGAFVFLFIAASASR